MAARPTRPEGTAFLGYLYDYLMPLANEDKDNSIANTVEKILALQESKFVRMSAHQDGLLKNAETPLQNLPFLLLQAAGSWSDDIVRAVFYWASRAEQEGLYKPTSRTARVSRKIPQADGPPP